MLGQRLDVVGHAAQRVLTVMQAQLSGLVGNRVLARHLAAHLDGAPHPEDLRRNRFVRAGVEVDGLQVHARLVVVGKLAGQVVVPGNRQAHHPGDHVVQFRQHLQVVLLDQALRIEGEHSRQEAAQRRNTVALPDAQDGGVDVRGPRLDGLVGVAHRAAGVVVAVELDAAFMMNDLPDLAHQRIHLPGRGDPHRVGQPHPVHAQVGHGFVHRHQIGLL